MGAAGQSLHLSFGSSATSKLGVVVVAWGGLWTQTQPTCSGRVVTHLVLVHVGSPDARRALRSSCGGAAAPRRPDALALARRCRRPRCQHRNEAIYYEATTRSVCLCLSVRLSVCLCPIRDLHKRWLSPPPLPIHRSAVTNNPRRLHFYNCQNCYRGSRRAQTVIACSTRPSLN